jgi:uncharacterized membrane protein
MRGFAPMILLLLIFLVIMIVPLILGELFPVFKWILMLYFCVTIFMFVKGVLGGGILTFIVSGILIYIFVIQMYTFFVAGYMLYLVASLGLSGIIIFGLPRGGGPIAAKAEAH